MDAACAATAGAMAAMIGADENAVRALAADTDVDVANLNAPGQIVISGESAKVELAVSLAKEHGIRRATLLNVAGAYHSRLMNSAYEQLRRAVARRCAAAPRFPVMSNVTGAAVETLPEIRTRVAGPGHEHGSLDGLHGEPAGSRLRFLHRAGAGRSPRRFTAPDPEGRERGERERSRVGPRLRRETARGLDQVGTFFRNVRLIRNRDAAQEESDTSERRLYPKVAVIHHCSRVSA